MSIVITGGSDDIIDVEGDVSEEFYLNDDDGDGDLIATSNGVVLRVKYSNSGVWRITPVVTNDSVTVTQAPEDDEDNYTDRVVIDADVKWVVHGIGFAK